MTDQILLYVIDTDSERARSLKAELAPLSNVTVLPNYADAVAASGGLDAVLVPLISAMEWGKIQLPAPLHRTQVIDMPDQEIARGRPRYAIPGVATLPGESLDPVAATRLVLQESFKAISLFNKIGLVKLRSVGAPALSLGFDKLQDGEALALLGESYRS